MNPLDALGYGYAALRPLLFRLDPERAHRGIFTLLRNVEHWPGIARIAPFSDHRLAQDLFGLHFPNPIGLAAGLDKNAEAPHLWGPLGFGFAELGTITAHAQPGNPPPRLFRLREDRALINRMGFNNKGAEAVAGALRQRLAGERPPIPIGINLGKSRRTPLGEALDDYRFSLRALHGLADYIVVNVSSPNTPGLRDLQSEEQLAPLLETLRAECARLARQKETRERPILLKLAPDLTDEALAAVAATAERAGARGLIATNTTLARDGLRSPPKLTRECGGLSGAPLRQRSTEVIRVLHEASGARLPIIGVGGIENADDAWEKIGAGASLIQIYTALIYQGPALPRRIARGLLEHLKKEGLAHIRDAVGTA